MKRNADRMDKIRALSRGFSEISSCQDSFDWLGDPSLPNSAVEARNLSCQPCKSCRESCRRIH
jgi:hypothetical protein